MRTVRYGRQRCEEWLASRGCGGSRGFWQWCPASIGLAERVFGTSRGLGAGFEDVDFGRGGGSAGCLTCRSFSRGGGAEEVFRIRILAGVAGPT